MSVFTKEHFQYFQTSNDVLACFLPKAEEIESQSTLLALLNPASNLIELEVAVQDDAKKFPAGTFIYLRPQAKDHKYLTEVFEVAEHKIILVPKSDIVLSISQWYTSK